MNTIKISGKIVKKETIKNNKSLLKLVLAMPLHMKSYDPEKGTMKQYYTHLSFTLFGLEKEQYDTLRKGNIVEIIGAVAGNCKADGTMVNELLVCIKSVTKGVAK